MPNENKKYCEDRFRTINKDKSEQYTASLIPQRGVPRHNPKSLTTPIEFCYNLTTQCSYIYMRFETADRKTISL
jgi:hypothetical protein